MYGDINDRVNPDNSYTTTKVKHSFPMNAFRENTIWEDNFDDQFGVVWEESNTSTSPSGTWQITDQLTSGLIGAGFDEAINSESGGNFALIDSDSEGDGEVQNASFTMINSIDLSNYENVGVEFANYYRRWNGSRFVGICTGGCEDEANWNEIEVLDVDNHGSGDATPPNPTMYTVDISQFAANEPEVWIRFRYYSDAWGWFWAVDDVRVIEIPDYDLILGNHPQMYQGSWLITGGDWEEDSVYFRHNAAIPESQLTSMNFRSSITNFGLETQDALLTIDHEGNLVNSDSQNLERDDVGTFKVYNVPVNNTDIGQMNEFDFIANSTLPDYLTDLEATPSNNYSITPASFEVTENIFALDNGMITNEYLTISQMNYLDQTETDPFGLQVRYPIFSNTELESVTVGFRRVDADDDGEWDLGGALINVYLLELEVAGGELSGGVIAEIENIVLEGNDLPIDQNVFFDYEFDEVIDLEAGKIYSIFVESLGGAPGLRFLRTPSRVGPQQVIIDLGGEGGYVRSYAPAIRMNLVREVCQDLMVSITGDFEATASGGAEPYDYVWTDENGDVVDVSNPGDVPGGAYTVTVTDANDCVASEDISWTSVNNHQAQNINVFPNPANNVINFDLSDANARSIQIFDMTGKLVNTVDVRNSFETVNVNSLSNGLYIYKINDINGATIKTDKFSIMK